MMDLTESELSPETIEEFFAIAGHNTKVYPVEVGKHYASLGGGTGDGDGHDKALIRAGLVYLDPTDTRDMLYTQTGVDFYKLLCI